MEFAYDLRQTSDMSTNAQRLGERVRERRAQLDVSQLAVGQAGGPSNTKLTEIENGRLEKLTSSTARKLDRGLRWEPGSARRVWDGGEPAPLRTAVDDLEELRLRVLASPKLSDERKAEMLATIDAQRASSERGSA